MTHQNGHFAVNHGLGYWKRLSGSCWLWLIALLFWPGQCISQTYDYLVYGVSGTNITITGYTGAGGAISIPSSIPGINGTVTSIGDHAFEYYTSVTNVTIPSTVATIGYQSFYGCGLTSVIIPSSVKNIGDWAFEDCGSLTSVTISNGVTSIGGDAFANCIGLTSITIPGSIATIEDFAFAWCSGLTNVNISSSVTSIGNFVFYGCSELAIANFLGNAPTAFGGQVFGNTASNFSIYYPSADWGWSSPTWAGYPAQPYDFDYTVYETNITITGYHGAGGALTIPSSIPGVDGTVTSIATEAFAVSSLTSVTIPSSVTSIGNGAFYGCSSLTNVTIPAGVTAVGAYLFEYCGNLTSVTIPNSVTQVAAGMFSYCSDLTDVTIPDSVTSIGDYAFAGCSSLSTVIIPGAVTYIGNEPFAMCTRLTAIVVDSQNAIYSSVGGVLYDKNQTTLIDYPGGAAESYSIPNGVTSIGNGAFFECSGLTSVTVPSSVESIGTYALAYCSGLTNVIISGGVTAIGFAAFYSCASLKSVNIPSSVSSIGGEAFALCSSLIAIVVDNQNSYYSSLGGVLFDKSHTSLIQYPGGVAGAYTVPDGVTDIRSDAFYGSGGLTSVTIPSGVTSIEVYAFNGCSGLTGAYFQGNPPSTFGIGVFGRTSSNFSIYYPSTAPGWSTPYWKVYPAQPYQPNPPGQQPVLSMLSNSGTVTPTFGNLLSGTNYQLQISPDLGIWSNSGPIFVATNTSQAFSQPFYLSNSGRLFFRLQSSQ